MEDKIKESIGIYQNGGDATLVHIAKTPDGIELVNSVSGPIQDIAKHATPYYIPECKLTYTSRGSKAHNFEDTIEHKVKIVSVMPSTPIFSRFVRLPPIADDEKRMKQLIELEARQNVPFPMEQVNWGYRIFEFDDEKDVVFHCAKKESIEAHVNELVGQITPDMVTPSIEAAAYAFNKNMQLFGESKDKGSILLFDESKLDRKTTNLMLFDKLGQYFARSIPLCVKTEQEAMRMIGEIHRSFSVYKAQQRRILPEEIYCTNVNDFLVQKIREMEKLNIVTFESKLIAKNAKIEEYLALGGALSGLDENCVDLLHSPNPTEKNVEEFAEELLGQIDLASRAFLTTILDWQEVK